MIHFRVLIFLIIGLLSHTVHAESLQEILNKTEAALQGDSNYMKITMHIQTPRWDRTVKMSSWSKGSNLSFIKVHYPVRDQGVTFLKRKNEMWQYIPRVERTLKIPPSMMMQSWMGSDLTNDDMVKESSLVDDYHASLIRTSDAEYEVKLIPKDDAAVTWGKVIMLINRKHYLPIKQSFYDEENQLIRVMEMSDIQHIKDRFFPNTWTITPKTEDKKGHQTQLHFQDVQFNIHIPNSRFTLRALKTKSH